MTILNSLLNKLLNKLLYKEIGWKELGEVFYRYTVIKTRWFNVYLHKLDAPSWHPVCHDHPWSFITVLLKGGYLERCDSGEFHRKPGTILYRPAEFKHNIIT